MTSVDDPQILSHRRNRKTSAPSDPAPAPPEPRSRESEPPASADGELRAGLERIAAVCEQIAEGNLESRLIGLPSDPHLRAAMIAINRMLDQTDAFVREARVSLDSASQGRFYRKFVLRGMHGSFRAGAARINAASEGMARQAKALVQARETQKETAAPLERKMRAVSVAVGDIAQQILQTARDLASLATGTTNDIQEVSTASSRTSASVVDASQAASELAGAFRKIQAEANQSAGAASQAAAGTEQIQKVIAELNQASQRIGGVVRLIAQIASQTNLLALNAAIEAARSGEAGRGFAVVASEVKTLAQKTAAATSEIGDEIQAIQQAATLAAESVTTISGTIHGVNQVASAIALAMSSQQEATAEIQRSVQQAATSTQAMAERIQGVTQAAFTTSESAANLLEPSDRLLDQAAVLRGAIDEFLAAIRE